MRRAGLEGVPDNGGILVVRPALESAVLAAFHTQVAATADDDTADDDTPDDDTPDDDTADVVETSQTGLTGVSTSQTLTRRSVDSYIIRRSDG